MELIDKRIAYTARTYITGGENRWVKLLKKRYKTISEKGAQKILLHIKATDVTLNLLAVTWKNFAEELTKKYFDTVNYNLLEMTIIFLGRK